MLGLPWADLDLEGVWSYNDGMDTPFERPGGSAAVVADDELTEFSGQQPGR